MTDGNLISQEIGDGEAQLIRPFAPDTSLIQASWNNASRREEYQLAQKQKAAAERDKRNQDVMNEVNASYKYNPLDRPAIEKLHNDVVKAVESGDKNKIDETFRVYKLAANDSLNDFQQSVELSKELRTKGETHHIDGAKEWAAAQIENNATDLGGIAANIGAREAAREKVRIGAEKITDVPVHMAKIAQSIPSSGTTEEAKPDAQGQIIRVQVPVYDTDAVKNALSVDYQTHERDLKPLYPTEKDYIEAGLKTVKTAPKVSQAFIPSSSATTGEKNKKVNITYNYGKNGEITGSDLQSTTGNDTKLATVSIPQNPNDPKSPKVNKEVIVVGTEGNKVKVLVPKDEKLLNDWKDARKKWLNDKLNQKQELIKMQQGENGISEIDANNMLTDWYKANPFPSYPVGSSSSMLLDKDNGGEAALHQSFGVSLDEINKGKAKPFVREDRSLKGKNVEVKTTKNIPLKIKELNISVPLKQEAKGYQLSTDKKKAKVTYKDGTTEIIVL